MARLGQRVLALSLRPVPPSHTVLEPADIDGQLTLLGILGLMGPPRPEALTAVAEWHAAGQRADAGIAMGLKGSVAAKEAEVLVLVDDNLASIVAAVREGRTVYDNIKKVINGTLSTHAGEAATMIALGIGVTFFALVEMEKQIRLRLAQVG